MPRLVPRVLFAALALSLSGLPMACGDDEPTAAPPGSTGGTSGRPTPPRPRPDSGRPSPDPDAGPDDEEEDSGTAGSGGSGGTTAPPPAMASECEDFKPAMFVGEDPSVDVIASSAQPLDFEITRAVATWETNCKAPTIRIDLSDGSCPSGRGHQLTFWFPAAAIDSGAIFPGLYTVFPEADVGVDGVRIRYTRPARLDPPTGIWGNCALATGSLNFVGETSTDAFSDIHVSRFYLELTPCDGRANEAIAVEGSFNVELQRGLREACPSD